MRFFDLWGTPDENGDIESYDYLFLTHKCMCQHLNNCEINEEDIAKLLDSIAWNNKSKNNKSKNNKLINNKLKLKYIYLLYYGIYS